MSKVEVKVDKIRSYQTLVYKNGNHSFPKKEYKDYEQEIRLQLMMLPRIRELVDTSLKIHFKCKNKVVGDLDNITKPLMDILQRNGYIVNDKQITELELKKSFGYKENTIEIEINKI
jgi:Holliday junction resolvase RusA-like endonuclease